MKYTYHIECPCLGEWNAFAKDTLTYLKGYMQGLRGQAPSLHYRLVRSDGKIIEEILPNDNVNIGQVAGFPTPEQYERAGNEALAKAQRIREYNEKQR